MITVEIPEIKNVYLEDINTFISVPKKKIQLEHSLISLRKWEAKWHKPFLDRNDHTGEESIDYIRCMTITQNVDPMSYYFIPRDEIQRIMDYIQDPMTATWFGESPESKRGGRKRILTAELIYYWMIELGIPFEMEKWHLNQLLTVIRVISVERSPKKKMSQKETLSRYAALNKARRQHLGTRG